MRNQRAYIILTAQTNTDLEAFVRVRIEEGYKPLGPAQTVVYPIHGNVQWYQTLIWDPEFPEEPE